MYTAAVINNNGLLFLQYKVGTSPSGLQSSMRVTQGEQSQSHKGAQIWEDALSRSKEYGVGQQLLFLVLRCLLRCSYYYYYLLQLWRKEVSLVILSFQLGSWKLLQLSQQLEAFTDSIDGIHVCLVWFLRDFVLKFWKEFLI